MKKFYIPGIILVFVALLLSVIFYSFNPRIDVPIASWHMINVNAGKLQGDANFLVIGDTNVMIDAGYASEAKKAVIPYLGKLGIKSIDHFFISHPHRDHYEGLAVIIDAGITIKNLYYKIPAPEIEDCCYDERDFLKFINYAGDRGTKLIQPQTGFKLSLPQNTTLEILHAQEGNLPDVKFDINDMSMIMQWRVNGLTVLFPGDLNKKLGGILSKDHRMQSDFLKMPHHGATSLAPNTFFESVDPGYVLVPGPEQVWCGDRGARARKWTIARKVPTWVNGINGNVKVEFKKSETLISPEQADGKCKLREFGQLSIKNDTNS